MKKILYLLALVPFAFSACNEENCENWCEGTYQSGNITLSLKTINPVSRASAWELDGLDNNKSEYDAKSLLICAQNLGNGDVYAFPAKLDSDKIGYYGGYEAERFETPGGSVMDGAYYTINHKTPEIPGGKYKVWIWGNLPVWFEDWDENFSETDYMNGLPEIASQLNDYLSPDRFTYNISTEYMLGDGPLLLVPAREITVDGNQTITADLLDITTEVTFNINLPADYTLIGLDITDSYASVNADRQYSGSYTYSKSSTAPTAVELPFAMHLLPSSKPAGTKFSFSVDPSSPPTQVEDITRTLSEQSKAGVQIQAAAPITP